MQSKYHKQIQEFIWNRKGKPFEFCKLKMILVGYSDYGGKKWLAWLKQTYNLQESREGKKIMLQKIPKQIPEEESSTTDD
ncbi:MAG: hypothetical protein PHF67_04905 [Candidatus Nanoarchaeia archaeon]|nr:hypothetical protein [Candidatus Nanoarchaeia archaeon]